MTTAVYAGNTVDLIWAPETTFGTEGTWSRRVRCRDAVFTPDRQHSTDEGQFSGVDGYTGVLEADVKHSGSLKLTKDFESQDGQFLLNFFGDTADSTLEAGVGQHILTTVNLTDYDIDSSASFQKNEVSDVVSGLGCKMPKFKISGNSTSKMISAEYDFNVYQHKDNDGSFDVGSLAYPTAKPFAWRHLTCSIGDDTINSGVTAFEINGENKATPEFASAGVKYQVEPQPKSYKFTGSITAWYLGTYLKGLYSAGTLLDIALTFEGSTLIGTTKYPKAVFAVTKALIIKEPVVSVKKGERNLITFEWEAMADTTNSNKQLVCTIQDYATSYTKHA